MKESHYKRLENPVAQAVVVLAGAVALMFCAWLLTVTNIYPAEPLFAWSIATAFMLLFAL